MADQPDTNSLVEVRKRRGAELRALVVSWQEQKPFDEMLTAQAKQIEGGKFEPSDDWCIMADEILAAYMSQPRMTAWDDEKSD